MANVTQDPDSCIYYTWYTPSSPLAKVCFLFNDCQQKKDCTDCHSGPAMCPSNPPLSSPLPLTQPQDCNTMIRNPPQNGILDCYEGKCHLRCHPGFVTSGPSTVDCRKPMEVALKCEPAVALVTGGQKSLQRVEVYSSQTDSCRRLLPSLPSLYSQHSVDYLDGQVILCGGFSGSHSTLTLLPNSTWTHSSNLVSPRARHSSGVHRTRLQLFGGRESTMEYMESGSNSWNNCSTCLPMDVPVDGCAAAISSTQVILTGGQSCRNCVHSYNWENGEVRRLEDMLEGRSSHGCTSYLDPEDGHLKVIVAGGWNRGDLRTAEVYNPETGTWRSVGDLTGPRRGLKLVTSEGGRVLAIGGRHQTPLSTVDLFEPSLDLWKAGPPLFNARSFHAVTSVPASRFCEVISQGPNSSSSSTSKSTPWWM